MVVSGSKDNRIKIWDPKTGNTISTLHEHQNTVVKVGCGWLVVVGCGFEFGGFCWSRFLFVNIHTQIHIHTKGRYQPKRKLVINRLQRSVNQTV